MPPEPSLWRLSPLARWQVRHQVPPVVALLIARYGDDAERVVRSCLEHPGYGERARYAFMQMLVEMRAIRRRQARGHPVTAYRRWRATWRRLIHRLSRAPADLSLFDRPGLGTDRHHP